jgi:hypothetical protein
MPITAVAATAAVNPTRAPAPRAGEQQRPSVAAAALPDMPKPVTPTTAAGYLMQVPSARVLEALASLQRALGQQTPSSEPPVHAAQRLAKAVAPEAGSPKVNLEA